MKRWRLIKERQLRGWTQETLSEKLGTTISMVSMIENGHRTPSLDTALALAKLFDSTTDELFAKTVFEEKGRA